MASISKQQPKEQIQGDGYQHVEGITEGSPELRIGKQFSIVAPTYITPVGRKNIPVGKTSIYTNTMRGSAKNTRK